MPSSLKMLSVRWSFWIPAVLLIAFATASVVRAADDDDNDNDTHKPSTSQKVLTNSIKMKLVLVPAGEFMMGNAESDDNLNKAFPSASKETFDEERPRHKVRITKDYYLGVSNVTLQQFRAFINDTNYKTEAEKDDRGGWGYDASDKDDPFEQSPDYTWRSWGFDQGDEHPVVNVTYNNAVAFCQWLSKKEGKTYRLPTEAEFEYACRAGTTTRYSCGDDPLKLVKVANVLDESLLDKIGGRFKEDNAKAALKANDGFPFTAPICHYAANPFGLYDMQGNAATWCSDWYSDDCYQDAPTVSEDPKGSSTGDQRVIRGGGWNSDPIDCRSASRDADVPTYRSYDLGFRVVREK